MGDGATGNGEKVAMRFDVVENLTIADFNYQNVISTMTLNLVMGHRLYSAELIPRMRVDIESVFGATLSFTCDGGEIT